MIASDVVRDLVQVPIHRSLQQTYDWSTIRSYRSVRLLIPLFCTASNEKRGTCPPKSRQQAQLGSRLTARRGVSLSATSPQLAVILPGLQSAVMPSTLPGGGQLVVSVLGAHAHALLKPAGVQHWLSGTSLAPCVARHDHRLLEDLNLPPGSSSCDDQCMRVLGRSSPEAWQHHELRGCLEGLWETDHLPRQRSQSHTSWRTAWSHQSRAAARASPPCPSVAAGCSSPRSTSSLPVHARTRA